MWSASKAWRSPRVYASTAVDIKPLNVESMEHQLDFLQLAHLLKCWKRSAILYTFLPEQMYSYQNYPDCKPDQTVHKHEEHDDAHRR